MQLNSFLSSSTTRDNDAPSLDLESSSSPEPSSPSTASVGQSCELQTSFLPLLDTLFSQRLHSSSSSKSHHTTKNDTRSASTAAAAAVRNGCNDSFESVAATATATFLNHNSEPLDLRKEPIQSSELQQQQQQQHLTQDLFRSSSSSSSLSPSPSPSSSSSPSFSLSSSSTSTSASASRSMSSDALSQSLDSSEQSNTPLPSSCSFANEPIDRSIDMDCCCTTQQDGRQERSEPQFYRDSRQNSNDDHESPLQTLAQHPHIVYPSNNISGEDAFASAADATDVTTAALAAAREAKETLGLCVQDSESCKDLAHDHVEQGLVIVQHKHAQHHQQYHHQQPQMGTQHSTHSNSGTTTGHTLAFSAQPELALQPSNTRTTSIAPLSSLSSSGTFLEEIQPSYNGYRVREDKEDEGDLSDEMTDSMATGAKKRSTGMGGADFDSMKKRRTSENGLNVKMSSSSTTESSRPLGRQFAHRRRCSSTSSSSTSTSASTSSSASSLFSLSSPSSPASAKNTMEWPSWPFKLGGSIIFDPSNLQEQRSEQHQRKLNRRRHRRVRRFHVEDVNRSLICWQSHSPGETCHCRKRSFSAATEWSYALSASSRTTADHHPEWIESVKKRKIHQQATKWTSTLSPPPYVKLLTMRDFWDVVEARLENKNDSRSSVRMTDTPAAFVSGGQGDSLRAIVQDRSERRRDVRQYPCPIPFLRGLWEEELRVQRERQMIPDTVRRPPRSKIFNARPIATTTMNTKPVLPSLLGTASASTTSASASPASSASSSPSATQVSEDGSQPSTTEMELSLRKKHRAAAIVRSHAISEGSDMSEYKPWKDGTVTPKQGSLRSLKDLRCNIMDPWPLEESKSKVECTRVLHRMREQLNIVINLQIHLRSMIKAAPTQWSFLLSIRHPGQVSIELLLALYGPHFMQTNSFRAIEQLLWGAKGHSQAQPHADTSSSTSSLLQA